MSSYHSVQGHQLWGIPLVSSPSCVPSPCPLVLTGGVIHPISAVFLGPRIYEVLLEPGIDEVLLEMSTIT